MDRGALFLVTKVRKTSDTAKTGATRAETNPIEAHLAQVEAVRSVRVLRQVGGGDGSNRDPLCAQEVSKLDGVLLRGQIGHQRVLDELTRVIQVQVQHAQGDAGVADGFPSDAGDSS